MIAKSFRVAAAALLLASTATAAFAQARRPAAPAAAAAPRAAAPAAPQVNHGPAIPGVCVFSNDQALARSSVGRAAQARLQVLGQQVSAELQAEQTALQTDAKAFEGRRASLTQDQQRQQVTPLAQREQALEQKAAVRQRELALTRDRALMRIGEQMDPIVRGVYQASRCSMLLNSDGAVFFVNPSMDITDQVVQQLNTRMPSITFDREQLPAGAQR
jgi:outer membrane protein